jgi:hypothetical protein
MRATSKQYPYYAPTTPRPVRHWNPHKAADNLRTLLGLAATAAFLTWMLVGWICGTWN